MRIAGLYPSEAELARVAEVATSALAPGRPGDRLTWLSAVRQVQPRFDWSRYPVVEEAYRSWADRTWHAALKHERAENDAIWEHARYAHLARLCGLVYPRKDTKIKEEAERARIIAALDQELPGRTHIEVFTDKRWCLLAAGYMQGERAYLAFRGTISLPNWRLNLDMHRRESGLHRGFARAWETLEPAVRRWLDGLPEKPSALTLTGHSLGGAMAVVAADSLRSQYQVDRVITFGAPRLGTPQFVEAYTRAGLEAVTRRYIHETDLVPRIPPARYGFLHVGARYFITRDGAIIPEEPEPTFLSFSRKLNQRAAAIGRGSTDLLVQVVAPGATPQGTAQGPQWVQSLLGSLQPLLYSYIGYAALGVAVIFAVFAAVYMLLRSWLRIHAARQDVDRHGMEGYMAAFAKLQGEWSKRFSKILAGFPPLFGGAPGLQALAGTGPLPWFPSRPKTE